MKLRNNVLRTVLNSFVIALFILPPLKAQSKSEQIDSLLNYCSNNGIFNGTIIVTENQNIIYRNAFGYADFDTGKKLEPDHCFYLASVSKQFTTMAVMILKERGKISYDDKLSEFFNEFPEYAEKVAVKHLMSHTSGIPDHYRFVKPVNNLSNQNAFDSLIQQKNLDFEPGTKYRYSNGGFILLAMIVEKVSGMSFHDFLEQNIFNPLGMKNTMVYDSNYYIKKRAVGYSQYKEKDDYHFLTTGAGGIYSNIDDLHKWDNALYNGGLVSDETLEEAFTPFRLVTNDFTEYGYGWGVDYEENIVMHGGALGGFRTYIWRDLDNKNSIILLTNNGSAVQIAPIKNAVSAILNQAPFELPNIPVGIVINETYRLKGIDKAVLQYKELQKSKSEMYNFSEGQLNLFGYYLLLNKQNIEDAINIFKLNTEYFPESSNTYDSLGEAFLANNDYEKALQNYKKSVSMNPENTNGKNMILKIESLINAGNN